MKKSLISIVIVSALALSACSSAPPAKPAETPKPIMTKTALASQIPTWFQQQPPNTSNELYVVGTAKSQDLSMVEHKAVIDAQTKLAFKLKGEMDAISKDYKRDSGGGFDSTTEQAARRVALGASISGYTVVNRVTLNEGDGFRTFVLLRYPLGEANPIVKGDEAGVDNPVTENHAQELHQELADLKKARTASKIARPDQTPPRVAPSGAVVVPVQQGGGIVVKVTPADEAEED